MLILVVQVTIKAGHEDEVLESLRQLEKETRREPGCLMYIVQRSRENSRRYVIYEQYKDEAALEDHKRTPHFKTYATDGFYRFVEEKKAELFNPL